MRKKGFSLLGLLTCVVLLAVVAVIVTPNIVNMLKPPQIEEQGSNFNVPAEIAKNSAKMYIQAVEWYYITAEMDNNLYQIPRDETVSVTNCVENICMNDLIEFKGKIPNGSDDYIKIDHNGTVIEAKLTFDQQEVIYIDGTFKN